MVPDGVMLIDATLHWIAKTFPLKNVIAASKESTNHGRDVCFI